MLIVPLTSPRQGSRRPGCQIQKMSRDCRSIVHGAYVNFQSFANYTGSRTIYRAPIPRVPFTVNAPVRGRVPLIELFPFTEHDYFFHVLSGPKNNRIDLKTYSSPIFNGYLLVIFPYFSYNSVNKKLNKSMNKGNFLAKQRTGDK